jgi:hypothetical protein
VVVLLQWYFVMAGRLYRQWAILPCPYWQQQLQLATTTTQQRQQGRLFLAPLLFSWWLGANALRQTKRPSWSNSSSSKNYSTVYKWWNWIGESDFSSIRFCFAPSVFVYVLLYRPSSTLHRWAESLPFITPTTVCRHPGGVWHLSSTTIEHWVNS